ncbi:hypothetical protein A2870_02665 [Candidatus Curtissbacteria bacterium RIFCSPHIGHO2_01_FULL_41_11]|uniref:Uncharacterized protein n=1 Tax=Candidatus Curtissbacteria bacterium RIFCSPHIGHO2_01_FULL_41_11 TaxID=1797711 RepID=A0A1F5G3S9_9BACT|nr:MAG: hypothetical protein A2870_02665 [Candidatus Curtissbacteria bacterium RIFCSPHIGHO2_01_FULL_41_11]
MAERQIDVDSKVVQIIDQTERLVSAWNEMFEQISTRTSGEWWKSNGVGSCTHPYSVSDVIDGIAKDAILKLMEKRSQDNDLPRIEGRYTCPFHRANFGCVLEGLKPPKCVAHIDNKDEIRAGFGINYFDFALDVYAALRRIQFSRIDDETLVDPFANEKFVEQTVGEIRLITDQVKNSPENTYKEPQKLQPEFA